MFGEFTGLRSSRSTFCFVWEMLFTILQAQGEFIANVWKLSLIAFELSETSKFRNLILQDFVTLLWVCFASHTVLQCKYLVCIFWGWETCLELYKKDGGYVHSRGHSHMKQTGMLVVSLRGVNLGFRGVNLVSLRVFRVKLQYFLSPRSHLGFREEM